MNKTSFSSVKEYIDNQDVTNKKYLKQLRSIVKKAAPNCVEKISWKMPSYYLDGWLIGFAAFKNHIGFYPGPSAVKRFQKEIKALNLSSSKGSIRLNKDEKLPISLIKKIVEFRVKENRLLKNKKRKNSIFC
jgi:uncharacterized protein YdhG (YjbR/CyaY superfamily)